MSDMLLYLKITGRQRRLEAKFRTFYSLEKLKEKWSKCLTLITKTSELNDRDFIIRNIYKDLY